MLNNRKDYNLTSVKLIEHKWITLSDGTKLSARIWMPTDAEKSPVPVILEYLPYRKNDNYIFIDSTTHPYFAGHGYASVRVDMRGSGDSDGLLLDEYLPQEQQDALEVLSWLAAQPWCNGNVGMIGISWGGFNGLQIASHSPPELKAIITMCSTDDRFTDDCHYMGGCVLGSDMLNWASSLFVYNALPPDPEIVGDRWRVMWLERLENTSPPVEQWLSHQFRDDYWKQGSVNEDYGAITCAVYAVGGWSDGYTNSIPRLLSGLTGPRKGLIGPWAHQWPQDGLPGPAIGFLQECLRWWDYWLKDMDNGIMDEPMLRVWLPEGVTPRACEAEWPGRWVAEASWPSKKYYQQLYMLKEGRLTDEPGPEGNIVFKGSEVTGLTAGSWCPGTMGSSLGLAIDQCVDDGLSLCFTTAPLDKMVEILGFPEVKLKISVDQPNALLVVRLCDVAPEGSSLLVSWGLLNLTHREGHEKPIELIAGQVYDIKLQLNFVGYKLLPGHRWRIAVSPTYWPHAWPSPKKVRLSLYFGSGCLLILPVRAASKLDESLLPFGLPERANYLEFEWLRHEESKRNIQYDIKTGKLQMTHSYDDGCRRLFESDLEYDSVTVNNYSIVKDDPLSAKVDCYRRTDIKRLNWSTRVETFSNMTADTDYFYLTNVRDAYEREVRIFTKSWTIKIPRQYV